MTAQLPLVLACGPRPKRSIQESFEAWLQTKDGETVLIEAWKRAKRLKAAGRKHYSMDAILHAIRFDRDVLLGKDEDGYRINDHTSSRLARLLMERDPDLAGFFELRKLRSTD